jgi:hypothetical protein
VLHSDCDPSPPSEVALAAWLAGYGFAITVEKIRRLSQHLRSLRGGGDFEYPWEGLEQSLNSSGQLPLVGYGSLMNADSAARTIGPSQRTPVVAFGTQRVYDYTLSDPGPYGHFEDERHRAALNAYSTGHVADAFNGVLIHVPACDIAPLRAREQGYGLKRVIVIDWNNTAADPLPAYILSCAPPSPPMPSFTDSTLLPHRPYHGLCSRGARSVSEQFEQLFLHTTFLGDRQTRVATWLASLDP